MWLNWDGKFSQTKPNVGFSTLNPNIFSIEISSKPQPLEIALGFGFGKGFWIPNPLLNSELS